MKRFFGAILGVALCWCIVAMTPHTAFTAETPAKPVADKPLVQADRTTKVAVIHEGSDVVGTKLAFQLKNFVNTSSLFTLTDKDEAKLKIFLTTVAEFPSRPGLASAYSVVWAFSQSEGTLPFMLARDVGLVTPDDIDALVAKLAQRTDGIAARYTYLFNK